MKNKKLIFSVLIISTIVISSTGIMIANDPFHNIKLKIEENNRLTEASIAEVGGVIITNTDIENYKAFASANTNAVMTDSDILKELIIEELLLQKAKQENVYVSIEDGIEEANKLRDLLKQQPPLIQETHDRLMETMGVSEVEYWNNIAPKEYQKILSIQNLLDLIIIEKQTDSSNPNLINQLVKDYRESLYQTALENNTLTIGDNTDSD